MGDHPVHPALKRIQLTAQMLLVPDAPVHCTALVVKLDTAAADRRLRQIDDAYAQFQRPSAFVEMEQRPLLLSRTFRMCSLQLEKTRGLNRVQRFKQVWRATRFVSSQKARFRIAEYMAHYERHGTDVTFADRRCKCELCRWLWLRRMVSVLTVLRQWHARAVERANAPGGIGYRVARASFEVARTNVAND